jgi:hypothetical protein
MRVLLFLEILNPYAFVGKQVVVSEEIAPTGVYAIRDFFVTPEGLELIGRNTWPSWP